ncbi:MAG TPA: outer membrane beta-barrel protein [Rhizomicrobium sp.]|jgi:hypothetical protein
MKTLVSGLLVAGAMTLAAGGAQAGAIAPNATPITFDSGFGNITVGGQLSGLAFYQNNATHLYPGDSSTYLDLDNAMVSVAKTDGFFQFYVQAGLYAFPTVGIPYDKSSDQNSFLGAVPVAYGKFQLTDTFSVSAGKLPTLVGAELPFTMQNSNIERGLLWWQEPVVSRGVQANYASGPLSIAVSWNDGFYSNVWNTFSGLISYAFDSANTLAFDASITPDRNIVPGSQIYDLMYTYNAAPWTIGPYVQYQTASKGGGDEWGVGLLASYQFTPEWSLNGRAEYETSSNSSFLLPFGPGSDAWSLTVTPTWQKGIFYIRGEASYASLGSNAVGYGKSFDKNDQIRVMLETGISL